jgi:SET domain-containing protein
VTSEDVRPSFDIGTKVALRVSPSPLHGLGVFAEQAIKPGQVVEICPTIFIPEAEEEHLERTILREYAYPWEGGRIMVLGYGSIYNHSAVANSDYTAFEEPAYGVGVHVVSAARPIEAGEEITVNYTGVIGNHSNLWFSDRSRPDG